MFNDLSLEIQNQLICRLILRNKFIQRLILQADKHDSVNYYDEASFLKHSTAKRRASNIKKVLKILETNNTECILGIVSFGE